MTSSEPVFIDDSDMNADWIKTLSWDIWTTDGEYELVTTVAQLLKVLDVDKADPSAQAAAIKHFMLMPAAIPMPNVLRSEIENNPEYVATGI